MYHRSVSNRNVGKASDSPSPSYNTRFKQAQISEATQDAASDDEDVEEIPREDEYPLYKDDLPNAFNGAVELSLDFISK
jgi:hypothetical protein